MRSIKLPNLDSDFFKNALKLASGNSLTQFVSLAAWPILARVYDPVSIAFYNVLLTFGILCANLSTLQYYQTILLAKERKEAERLVVTCLVNTAIVTTVVFCLILKLKIKKNLPKKILKIF